MQVNDEMGCISILVGVSAFFEHSWQIPFQKKKKEWAMVDGNYCKTSSKEIMGSLCCPPIKEMTLVLANSILLMLVFLSDTSSSHMPSLWSPANEVSYSVLILYWNPILPMMFS